MQLCKQQDRMITTLNEATKILDQAFNAKIFIDTDFEEQKKIEDKKNDN